MKPVSDIHADFFKGEVHRCLWNASRKKKGGLMMDKGVYRCDKASTVKCK